MNHSPIPQGLRKSPLLCNLTFHLCNHNSLLMSLSRARGAPFTLSHTISLISLFVLTSPLYLTSPKSLYPSVYPTMILYTLLTPHMHATSPTQLTLLLLPPSLPAHTLCALPLVSQTTPTRIMSSPCTHRSNRSPCFMPCSTVTR